jgi:hypothetical protein
MNKSMVSDVTFFRKIRLRVADVAGMDTPLALGITVRVWAMAAGLITLIFVTRNLSAKMQGYYFTFGSLSQLTTLVDLGLQILVLQFASHEAAHLTFGRKGAISGPAHAIERLVSLARFSLTWFGVLSLVLIPGMFFTGRWLFSTKGGELSWQWPWFLLCVLVAIDLILNNFVWLLEGTNQLKLNYSYRLIRGIVTPLTLWIFLGAGWGLLAIPLSVLTGIISLLLFLAITSPVFVLTFIRVRPREHRLSWRREIMPLQWRLSVSQIASFATYSLFVPVAFRFIGPEAAGQVGLSWTLVDSMTNIAVLWLTVKFPAQGAMVAKRNWQQLDRETLLAGVQAASLGFLGATAIVFLKLLLQISASTYAARLLPVVPLALFAYAAVPKLVSATMINYLRAHRKEPIVVFTVVMTPLMICVVVGGAISIGTLGVAAGYFLVMTFFMLPTIYWITLRCRAEWHR